MSSTSADAAPTPSPLNIEDPDQLGRYLRRRELLSEGDGWAMQVLPGGVSNRTVLVTRDGQEPWVIKQALAKLRVSVDWFSDPARVHREAAGLRWLARLAPQGSVPAFVHEDFEHHLLIMQAVPQPHLLWKSRLLAGHVDPDAVAQFGRLLAAVHGNAARRQAEVAPQFADRSYFESLRLEPYYAYTGSRVPAAEPFLQALIRETRAIGCTLVHGDYSPKNILIHGGRLVLLDHEVIHWGDPAFDLGFSMTHLLSKAHHLPARREPFRQAAEAYWEHYHSEVAGQGWTGGLEARAVRHTLACLLARVAGRSPLEYLTPEEQARQQAAVVRLMQRPPPRMVRLIRDFVAAVDP